MFRFLLLSLALIPASAHAKRWEFACQSLDGSIAFHRSYLNLVEKDLSGKKVVRAFRNLNINNDPAYADERSPLGFVEEALAPKKKTVLHLVNMKPGQDAVANLRLNHRDRACARNTKAYTTTFRVHLHGKASYVPFHCEEGWFHQRADAQRCRWKPNLLPARQ